MQNETKFEGILNQVLITPYVNKDQQSHSQVDFVLVSNERIAQGLKLRVKGSIGDQLASLQPQPGQCSMVAHIEFHTFDWQGKVCQEIRVWKLEVTMFGTGESYIITSNNKS